jgi:2-haloacid dehalogenase
MLQQVVNPPKAILFDVYHTLLDMSPIEKRMNALLDSKRGYLIWFEQFMQYCFVDNCTKQFSDFTSIATATMQMTAKTLGTILSQEEITGVLDLLKQLPVFEDVQEALSQLHELGFRIAALTNSPEETINERMERTGLISYFEMVLSAEHIKKYKPCTEVYQWAADKLEIGIHEMLLVSSHSWDIMGGATAGMQTAYVRQNEKLLYPLAPKPNYISKNLVGLVNQLEIGLDITKENAD